jgi:hypothetical protein
VPDEELRDFMTLKLGEMHEKADSFIRKELANVRIK